MKFILIVVGLLGVLTFAAINIYSAFSTSDTTDTQNLQHSVASSNSLETLDETLAMKIKVIEEVNENGQTITKVTIVKGLKLNPIITGVLISFASLYLILMIGRVIYKNCWAKDESNDEDFESVSQNYESEVSSYYDEFDTRTSYTEYEHHGYSDIGRPKDTMSNSSIDQIH